MSVRLKACYNNAMFSQTLAPSVSFEVTGVTRKRDSAEIRILVDFVTHRIFKKVIFGFSDERKLKFLRIFRGFIIALLV